VPEYVEVELASFLSYTADRKCWWQIWQK